MLKHYINMHFTTTTVKTEELITDHLPVTLIVIPVEPIPQVKIDFRDQIHLPE